MREDGFRAGAGRPARAADQAAGAEELLDRVVTSIFDIGMILQAAADLPRDGAAMRITEALRRLDDVVREVRHHMFAERVQGTQSGFARRPPLDMQGGLAQTANRVASLKERVVQTAYALQSAAADTAALLEQRACATT